MIIISLKKFRMATKESEGAAEVLVDVLVREYVPYRWVAPYVLTSRTPPDD